MAHSQADLVAAFRDLAAGRGVRRGRHSLEVDGRDCSALFRMALEREGFRLTTVREVAVATGERAPAFLVRDSIADFGWVFWEKFSDTRERKLFGSAVRNRRGDWAIQLGTGSREPLWVNLAARSAVDPNRPSSLG